MQINIFLIFVSIVVFVIYIVVPIHIYILQKCYFIEKYLDENHSKECEMFLLEISSALIYMSQYIS